MDQYLRDRVRLAEQHRLSEPELERLLADLRHALRVQFFANAAAVLRISGHIKQSDSLLADIQSEISSEPATETLEAYVCSKCKKSFGSYDFAIHRRDRLCQNTGPKSLRYDHSQKEN